jgi:hypothetical protein
MEDVGVEALLEVFAKYFQGALERGLTLPPLSIPTAAAVATAAAAALAADNEVLRVGVTYEIGTMQMTSFLNVRNNASMMQWTN